VHDFKTLSKIIMISVFILAAFGCSSKNQVIDTDFGFTAESVPEGILLTFRNIPSDAIRMMIHVNYFEENEITGIYNVYSSFTDIRDSSFTKGANPSIQLERVKQSGKVIFPFVKAGEEYSVMAYVFNQQDHDLMLNNDESYVPIWAETTIIPESGTFFRKEDVKLSLNNDNSYVTLLSEPIFSSEIAFDKQKYSFSVTIIVPKTGSIGVADHHFSDGLSDDGLTWVFEPQMTETLREYNNNWLAVGKNYSAWANVFANIIYDDIFWYVEIVKTQEFNYSL